MTPFNQVFRLWLRRAPLAERALTALGVLVFTALVTWAAVPISTADNDLPSFEDAGTAPPVDASGSTLVTATTAAGDVPGSSDISSSPTSFGAATTAPGASGPKTCPSGDGAGVTDSTVKIAVTLTDVAGGLGSGAFGVPSSEMQRGFYQAVIDALNESGGIGCRQIEADYYSVNALDSAAGHQTCLRITGSNAPLIVFDNGGIGADEIPCFVQKRIPYFTTATAKQAKANYPLVFTSGPSDVIFRNALISWRRSGALDEGGRLAKLGVIYHDCVPEIVDAAFDGLRAAQIPDSNISSYNLGSCASAGNPADILQAISQFRRAGVTHVIPVFMPSDFSSFTRTAQQQGFKPKYRIADYAVLATAYGSFAPDWDNIDGAMAMSSQAAGEERTPGFQPTAGTRACNEVMGIAGLPTVYEQQLGWGGVACNHLWLLRAMVDHSSVMSRATLAQGLNAAGSIDMSYPAGPADFSQPGVTYGGQFFRPIIASAQCRCYRLTGPTVAFQPGFP
jgi:hypothetical protein